MSTAPLLPKATAKWLVENTSLTFQQIGDFCQLHLLEVEAIANDEVARGIVPFDPVASGQVTAQDIQKCEKDTKKSLTIIVPETIRQTKRKGGRYTPVSKRQDKPNAIAWVLKHHPDMADMQIIKLLGTTKATIQAVREKTHWNAKNIHSTNPVDLGLCKQTELDAAVATIKVKKSKK